MNQEYQSRNLEDVVVQINRCTTVTKGGKTLSFSALVVVGDKKGMVGYGFGKAREVPNAVTKAIKDAKKQLKRVFIKGSTIPHETTCSYRTSRVFMKPAVKGTGIKAGASARAVLELAGVRDILTKCYGSRNPLNVVKATMGCLLSLKNKEDVERLRGVSIR